MVQLGPLLYALLESLDGRRGPAELAGAMSERLGRRVEEEHVARLVEKLGEQGLLAGAEENAPAPVNPLLGLRWKYLVTDPGVTARATRPFTGLFRPWIVVPVLIAFLGVAWFVLVQEGVAGATAQAFRSPELLLLVFAIAIASAGFHELGHAAAARYGGARPGGMGVGLYVVWPAFYTDVTDAYRLPRKDRLRVDLGGLYFNSLIAVATVGAWLILRVDALLLIVALQLLQMVQQLSPVIRADGYHILSDITGVPDLYQHLGPTLKRLVPWRRNEEEGSALTGRARAIVTVWVLLVVPLLLAISLSLILLFPRLIATAWASAQAIAGDIPDGGVAGGVLSVLRLVALTLPVLGVAVLAHKLLRTLVDKARRWSEDRPARRGVVAFAGVAMATLLLWAWWPSGQYRPVRASDSGTLGQAGTLLAQPGSAVRPEPSASLAPGKHLALALIPEGGATKERPAAFLIKGDEGQEPVVVVSPSVPEPAPAAGQPAAAGEPGATETDTPTTPQPVAAPSSTTSSTPVEATSFPFKLPDKPGPNGTQALAVNTKDGSVKYTVAYSVVTVSDGAPVDNTNEAYAFASCNACTTVAVSFQVVLIVGYTDMIAPINIAVALNANCPRCITTAIANQIVVTLEEAPSEEMIAALMEALDDLDQLDEMFPNGSPADVAAAVDAIESEIQQQLDESGLIEGDDDDPEAPAQTGTSTAPAPSDTGTTETPAEPQATTEQEAPPTQTTPAPQEQPPPTETTTSPTETSTTEEPSSTGTTTSPAP